MRSYEEISNRIMQKGDEIIESRRIRAARIKHTSYAVSGLCAAVITGVGVWRLSSAKPERNNGNSDEDIVISADVTTENTTSSADNMTVSTVTSSANKMTVTTTSVKTSSSKNTETSSDTSALTSDTSNNTASIAGTEKVISSQNTGTTVSQSSDADTTKTSETVTSTTSPNSPIITITTVTNNLDTTKTSIIATTTTPPHYPTTTTTTVTNSHDTTKTSHIATTTTPPHYPTTQTTTITNRPDTTTPPTTTSLPSTEHHSISVRLMIIDDKSGMPVEGLDITVSRNGTRLFGYNSSDYPEMIKQYFYSAANNEDIFWDVTVNNIPEEFGYEQNTYSFCNVSVSDDSDGEYVDIILSLHNRSNEQAVFTLG